MRGLEQTADSSRKCCEVHKSLRGLRVSRRSSISELQIVLSNPENQWEKTKPGNPERGDSTQSRTENKTPEGRTNEANRSRRATPATRNASRRPARGNTTGTAQQADQTDGPTTRQTERSPKKTSRTRAGPERPKPRRKTPPPGGNRSPAPCTRGVPLHKSVL